MGTGSKDKRDVYYYQAKSMGYRARSAFKLIDIDKTFNIFKGVKSVIDLCAAPGSWSQVLSKIPDAKVLAIDVQEIAPIDGVITMKEDITAASCQSKTRSIFNNEKVDLVVCDGAPDVTGFHDLDEFLQTDLLKAALSLSLMLARPGSTFVGKCFRGEFTGHVVRHFRKFYRTVNVVKPRSSRGASMECFLLCSDLAPCGLDPMQICVDEPLLNFQIIECGEGENPDYTFEGGLNTQPAAAQPISPPYKEAIDLRRLKLGRNLHNNEKAAGG